MFTTNWIKIIKMFYIVFLVNVYFISIYMNVSSLVLVNNKNTGGWKPGWCQTLSMGNLYIIAGSCEVFCGVSQVKHHYTAEVLLRTAAVQSCVCLCCDGDGKSWVALVSVRAHLPSKRECGSSGAAVWATRRC